MTSFNHILSEMPLVLFTILVQAVIGLSLVYAPAVGGKIKCNHRKIK
ncbi:hypothetical protein ACTA3W_001574 [Campylobacter jejuni]|nr:hypothetical protein [Campylobacter jejuni]EJP9887458.1 hypothetical protein [Campylobacter jejuni]